MQSIAAVDPGSAIRDSTVYETTSIPSSRAAGEKDERYITEHGDQQSEESSNRYAAPWILQVARYVSTGLNPSDRRKEDSKHREERLIVLLGEPIVRIEITHKYIRWKSNILSCQINLCCIIGCT